MKFAGRLAPFAAVLVVTACAGGGLKVDGKLGPGISMTGFSSFAILAAPKGVGERTTAGIDFIENRVAPEVSSVVAEKGYVPAPKESADLLVAVFISQTGEVDAIKWGYSTYGWEIWGPWWGSSGVGAAAYQYNQEYRNGTIVIDVVSAKAKKVLYRGVAEATMGLHGEPDQDRIHKAVEGMLKDLPPRS